MSVVEETGPQIFIADHFPNLQAVQENLHPEAQIQRPSIDEYALSLEAQGRMTPAVAEAIDKAKLIRESTDCIVYIAGALTGVSEELKLRYGAVSNVLSAYTKTSERERAFFGYVPHLHGTDPIKHPDVTPDEVRDIDFLWAVVAADIHVNFLDPTAHGNAIEEGWAESRLIPTVYLNTDGNRLSRLTLGMNNVLKKIEYVKFQNEDEATDELEEVTYSQLTNQPALDKLKVCFDELFTWMKTFPGRDPREFHYVSFSNLNQAALRANGLEVGNGYDIEEFTRTFDPKSFAVYVRGQTNKHYGKVGYIDFASDYRGIGVLMRDGSPYLFDPLTAGIELSFWPIDRDSPLADRPDTRSYDELIADPNFDFEDVFGRE